MINLLLLCRVVVQDLWHDRKISFCIAAALVAVIAPLLLLFGLKHGVVTQLQEELLSDPRNLEVRMLSSGTYSQEWIDELQAMEGVGFAIGQTRSLNTVADLFVSSRQFVENAEIIPTAKGDPLLATAHSDLDPTSVILSARAAQRLGVGAGDTILMRVHRKLNQVNERGELRLTVVDVLAESRFGRAAAFVHSDVLLALERFRDGGKRPEFGLETGQEMGAAPVIYSKVRLYAADVDAVSPLTDWLHEQRIETASRLAEIEAVKAINEVLTLIFTTIALTALVGCVASLIGSFISNIDRKRKSIATLRLLGFNTLSVAGFVVLQALLITAVAYVAGLALYLMVAQLFNGLLVGSQATSDFAVHITVGHAVVAFLMTAAIALAVAMISALRAVRIQPAESLREI